MHAVFVEPKDREVVADIVRSANTKLSQAQQIRGFTVWPEDTFPTTPTQKVKKREVIERILTMGKEEAPTRPASVAQRALSDVERLVARTANVPDDRIWPEAQLSADVGLDSLGRVDLLGVIERRWASLHRRRGARSRGDGRGPRAHERPRGREAGDGDLRLAAVTFVRSIGLILQQFLCGRSSTSSIG